MIVMKSEIFFFFLSVSFVFVFFCLFVLLVFVFLFCLFLVAAISFGWLEGWPAPLGPCSGNCLRKKEGYFCDKSGRSFSVSQITCKGNLE